MMKECRCSRCSRLLAKVRAVGELEIVCPRCKTKTNFICKQEELDSHKGHALSTT